jgi:glycosyl transferase family 25
MRAYVINLPRSPARRVSVAAQLQGTGLDHVFVDGVDGRALAPVDRGRLIDESAVARYPQWLTPGALGCALSHLRTYELIVDSCETAPATAAG